MSSIRLHVSCEPKTELPIAIKDARSLAKMLDITVILRFNGINLAVDEDSRIADIQKDYDEQYDKLQR